MGDASDVRPEEAPSDPSTARRDTPHQIHRLHGLALNHGDLALSGGVREILGRLSRPCLQETNQSAAHRKGRSRLRGWPDSAQDPTETVNRKRSCRSPIPPALKDNAGFAFVSPLVWTHSRPGCFRYGYPCVQAARSACRLTAFAGGPSVHLPRGGSLWIFRVLLLPYPRLLIAVCRWRLLRGLPKPTYISWHSPSPCKFSTASSRQKAKEIRIRLLTQARTDGCPSSAPRCVGIPPCHLRAPGPI